MLTVRNEGAERTERRGKGRGRESVSGRLCCKKEKREVKERAGGERLAGTRAESLKINCVAREANACARNKGRMERSPRASRQSACKNRGKRSGGADRRSAFRGLVFLGEKRFAGLCARGGEELARDRRDRAVRPAASEARGARRRVAGRPFAVASCPCSCARRYERERLQGPAGRRPEVPASGRSASSALSAEGGASSDCVFRPRQEAALRAEKKTGRP